MFRRPRFKAQYHVRVVSEDETVLLWETGYRILRSRLIALLAPWLDGRHAVEEIASGVAEHLSPLDVMFGIQQLMEGGYIEEASNESENESAFFGLLGNKAPRPARAVQVRSAGNVEVGELEAGTPQLTHRS